MLNHSLTGVEWRGGVNSSINIALICSAAPVIPDGFTSKG